MDFFEARKRNVLIKILHCYLNDKKLMDKSFEVNELKSTFYLKERDIKLFLEKLFDKNNDKYILKEEYRIKLADYEKNYNKFIKNRKEIEKTFIEQYEIINKIALDIEMDVERFNTAIESSIENIEKLHWILLPIYSEQIIENIEVIPEENIYEYYNNYHAIQDIYFALVGKGIDYKSVGGDNNLNKEFNVNIYSSRWGHDDNYIIKRTVDGWYLTFLMNTGDFDKNGQGAFFESLEHDSIFFPREAVSYALEILWDEADNTDMDIEEIKYKFNQIVKWINEVEKASKKYQPEWCNYF